MYFTPFTGNQDIVIPQMQNLSSLQIVNLTTLREGTVLLEKMSHKAKHRANPCYSLVAKSEPMPPNPLSWAELLIWVSFVYKVDPGQQASLQHARPAGCLSSSHSIPTSLLPSAEVKVKCSAAEVTHMTALPMSAQWQNDAELNGKGNAANLVVVFVTCGGFFKHTRRPRFLDGCHLVLVLH